VCRPLGWPLRTGSRAAASPRGRHHASDQAAGRKEGDRGGLGNRLPADAAERSEGVADERLREVSDSIGAMVMPTEKPEPRTPFEEQYLALAKKICLEEIDDPRYEIFLFGSRARGHCDHGSDVDIGIAGPEPWPNGLSRLFTRLMESDVPWRCDPVDFALVKDEAFHRHAYREREIWRAAK